MEMLDKGTEKIDKICKALREETLEPARQAASEIIEEGKKKAGQILAEAKKQAEKIVAEGRVHIEQERNVFESSLSQAAKQSVEALKQQIENQFFSESLKELLKKDLGDPKVIGKLINSMVKAVETEGLSADLSVAIAKDVSPEEVNALLLSGVFKKLKEQSIVVGSFGGGVQVRLDSGRKQMTLDMSDKAIEELLASYLRKDFRKRIFHA